MLFFGFEQLSRIREMNFVAVKRKQRDGCNKQKAQSNQRQPVGRLGDQLSVRLIARQSMP